MIERAAKRDSLIFFDKASNRGYYCCKLITRYFQQMAMRFLKKAKYLVAQPFDSWAIEFMRLLEVR
jgi:hypothetical protein